MTDVAKKFHLAEMLDFCRNNKIVIQPVVGVTNKMLYGDCNVYLIKLQLYHIIIAALSMYFERDELNI
jgi:hypothetical protein